VPKTKEGTSRGFGYVTFADSAGTLEAIVAMNDVKLSGSPRPLRVVQARPRDEPADAGWEAWQEKIEYDEGMYPMDPMDYSFTMMPQMPMDSNTLRQTLLGRAEFELSQEMLASNPLLLNCMQGTWVPLKALLSMTSMQEPMSQLLENEDRTLATAAAKESLAVLRNAHAAHASEDAPPSDQASQELAEAEAAVREAEGKDMQTGVEFLREILWDSSKLAINPEGSHARSWDSGNYAAVILRDVPASSTTEEIRDLFGAQQTAVRGVVHEFGDNWFVFFSTNDEAAVALEEVRSKTIAGAPVQGRVRPQSSRKSPSQPKYQFSRSPQDSDGSPGSPDLGSHLPAQNYPPTRLLNHQAAPYVSYQTAAPPDYADDSYEGHLYSMAMEAENDSYEIGDETMFPYMVSVVVDFIARESSEDHLATFLKNAYCHEPVMVHIPTDWQSSLSLGYAFAEFEDAEAAQDVCVQAAAAGVSPGSIQIMMRAEWEKRQHGQPRGDRNTVKVARKGIKKKPRKETAKQKQEKNDPTSEEDQKQEESDPASEKDPKQEKRDSTSEEALT